MAIFNRRTLIKYILLHGLFSYVYQICQKCERIATSNVTDCSDGHLSSFPDIPTCTEQLKLSGNNIESFPNFSDERSSLWGIWLSYNDISWIEGTLISKAFPFLRFLDLSYNKMAAITEESFAEMISLTVLYLDYNKVEIIYKESFVDLESLTQLYLAGNLITFIDLSCFESLESLTKLDLSKNRIEFYENNNATWPHKLRELLLNDNKLKTFPSLPPTFQEDEGEPYLDVTGNPLFFGCIHHTFKTLTIGKVCGLRYTFTGKMEYSSPSTEDCNVNGTLADEASKMLQHVKDLPLCQFPTVSVNIHNTDTDDIILECSGSGNPVPLLQILNSTDNVVKRYLNIHDRHSSVIMHGPVPKSHFSCKAENVLGTVSKKFLIVFGESPTSAFTTIPYNETGKYGYYKFVYSPVQLSMN